MYEFANPPISEVVLGAQFSVPKGYSQILAGDVWKLYKDDYPHVAEQPALMPSFETFGVQPHGMPMPQFQMSTGGSHDRFWFINGKQSELIQFQQDKFLHNWRKIPGVVDNEYPRFNCLIEKFNSEIDSLNLFMSKLIGGEALSINQCEISYINHIAIEKDDRLSDWLSFINLAGVKKSNFSCVFNEVITDSDKPIGRLYIEIFLGSNPFQQESITLSISFKGAPLSNNIESCIDFIRKGHIIITDRFVELTTAKAHEKWGVKK